MQEGAFALVSRGEVLMREFPYNMQKQLASTIEISPKRIAGIVSNHRRVTAERTLHLSL